jgi:cytochrome o ubiquinol oxidase subunit 2
MNSFWIPQLGGQVYAMSGMDTHLNLMAGKVGIYEGVSANLSGEGFAGMHFKTNVVSPGQFESWSNATAGNKAPLTGDIYDELAKPSQDVQPQAYGSVTPGLYDTVVMKYVTPSSNGKTTDGAAGGSIRHDFNAY